MPKKGEKRFKEREVFPGEKLAVIEEYNQGKGTYQNNGRIFSEELGKTLHDINDRAVIVEKNTPELTLTEEGMVVFAEVGSVARRDARVDIFMMDGQKIHPTYSGVVHISDISRDYIKNIDSAIRNGDIIKAKIVNTKNNLNQLSLAGPEFGVVYAYCSRCGELLEYSQGKLNCPTCTRVERRKTARSYGKEDLT
jgi:exosome complex component CSL4